MGSCLQPREGREVSEGEKPPLCIKKGERGALSEEWKSFFLIFCSKEAKNSSGIRKLQACRNTHTHLYTSQILTTKQFLTTRASNLREGEGGSSLLAQIIKFISPPLI